MGRPPGTLSSSLTLYQKAIYPSLLMSVFAISTLTVLLSPGPKDSAVILAMLTLFGALMLRANMPLKRVRMDDQALHISNYKREVTVPLGNVAEVVESWWPKGYRVFVKFHSATEFGSRIVFTPKMRWLAWWSPHPVVAEIRGAVARAAGAGPVIPGAPRERHQPPGL